jgi:hypothetical protein
MPQHTVNEHEQVNCVKNSEEGGGGGKATEKK